MPDGHFGRGVKIPAGLASGLTFVAACLVFGLILGFCA